METTRLSSALPLLLLAQLAAIAERVDATTCYDCSGDSVHNACEFDAESNGRRVVCISGEPCATRRVTYVLNGAVFSFQRGCKSQLIPDGETPNKCDSDSETFQTCSSICDGDMCNDDSGVPIVTFQTRKNEGSTQSSTGAHPDNTTCYSCLGDSTNTLCITNPEKTKTVICTERQRCATKRTEYVHNHEIRQLVRGCEGQLIVRGEPVDGCDNGTSNYRTCLSLCRGNMCNNDDGDPTEVARRRSEAQEETAIAAFRLVLTLNNAAVPMTASVTAFIVPVISALARLLHIFSGNYRQPYDEN